MHSRLENPPRTTEDTSPDPIDVGLPATWVPAGQAPGAVVAGRRGEALVAALAAATALFLPGLKCLVGIPIDDPDVWWHLRAGQWIVEHGRFPTVDLFSTHGFGKPWAAYSWIPELILYGLYQTWGLRGLLLYTAGFSVAIIAAFHQLLRRIRPAGSWDVILVLAATLGLIPITTPRPWLASILFFVIELDLLLTAGRTGNHRLLVWLVPLFVLWANAHIQFIVGLIVLAAAASEPLLARIVPPAVVDESSRRLPFRWMLAVFGLSVAATLVNPYHVGIYRVAAGLLTQTELWNLIQELVAMPFRSPCHWIVLATTGAAAFALGWRRRTRLLLVMLFPLAAYSSFRSQRDAWFVLLVGLTIVACCLRRRTAGGPSPRAWVFRLVPAGVAVAVLAGCLAVSPRRLEEKVSGEFPCRATRFVAAGHFPGPLFNPFSWGGYLILHLPQYPVSIDGRTMVHGQQRVVRHFHTLRGQAGWEEDPELAQAGLVILPRRGPLAALLERDDRFQLVYQDQVAAVFCAHRTPDA